MESLHAVNLPFPPGVRTLRSYDRGWLRGDVVAGITVAAYAVPQVMAYAELAGLPAVVGLYAILVPLALYALLGSSRQLSVGPESTTALLTAAAIGPLAAGDPARYAALAAVLAVLVAAYCVAAWALRLGFVADLLSRPVLVGYLTGVAITMIVGQLGTVTGVDVEGASVTERLASFVANLDTIDPVTTALSLAVLTLLLIIQRWLPRAPGPLIVVLGASAVVAALGWADRVAVVGEVPFGLPDLEVPAVTTDDLALLALPALGLMIVGYTDNVLTARSFANRRHEDVDANSELLALGAANLGAGVTQGMPVSSSGSRTALGDAAGSRTQVYSLVMLAAIVATLLVFRPVLETFPLAALGALVVYAALRLIDLPAFGALWRFRTAELALGLATTIAVLALDILLGVLVAVGLSVIELLYRVARPHDAIQGLVPGMAGMHDVDDYPQAQQVPGLVVYRYDSPLFFANAADFRRRALAAVDEVERDEGPVSWLLLNVESNVEVDSTAVAALEDLRRTLADRGIVLALARVKQDLAVQLLRAGFLQRIGSDKVFPTLPTAREGYARWQEQLRSTDATERDPDL
jgi:high affinity sulfate transporter 1